MKTLIAAVAALSLFALAPAARAASTKGGSTQTHHCYKDGALQEGKTHKQCTADGGQWKKDTDASGKTTTPAADDKAKPAKDPNKAPDKAADPAQPKATP
jgi:hypothetical protein